MVLFFAHLKIFMLSIRILTGWIENKVYGIQKSLIMKTCYFQKANIDFKNTLLTH